MICRFCENYVPTAEDALNDDWIPGFFDEAKNEEIARPVCPACTGSRLRWDDASGLYVLPKPKPKAVNGPWVMTPTTSAQERHVRVSSGAKAHRNDLLASVFAVAGTDLDATARLIAAAPDMRDLLTRTMSVMARYAQHDDEADGLLDVIQHVLARVEG